MSDVKKNLIHAKFWWFFSAASYVWGFFFFFSGKIFRLPSFLWYVPLLINYLFFFFKVLCFRVPFSSLVFFRTVIFSVCFFNLAPDIQWQKPCKSFSNNLWAPPLSLSKWSMGSSGAWVSWTVVSWSCKL